MTTQDERVKARAIIEAAGIRVMTVDDQDGVLWVRINGPEEDGLIALRALQGAGINQVIDNDLKTHEAAVIAAQGAMISRVWVDYVDGEPLFRE